MKSVRIAFAIVLLILATAPTFADQAGIHLIHLDPNPSVSGSCPAHVVFHGHIEVTQPVDVSIEWLRSDGASSSKTLHFGKAGTHQVADSWTISKTYSGWEQLIITSPARMQTAKASFHVHCGR